MKNKPYLGGSEAASVMLIPKRCCYCGTDKSVKYEMWYPKRAYCNACILKMQRLIDGDSKEEV